MIIQKVINNNVVSTFDMNNHEVILMGKGIGFRKKAGDELDKTKIEKIFTLDQREKVLLSRKCSLLSRSFMRSVSMQSCRPIKDLLRIWNIWKTALNPESHILWKMKRMMWNSTRETRKNIRRLIYAARKLSSTLKVITATPCP